MAEEPQVQVEETEAPAEMNIYDAIREVLKKASHRDGLLRGINEAARAIDRGDAKVCFLAENCDLKEYKGLIRALCTEKDVPLVMVSDRNTLGEWAGMCKVDTTGTARHIVKCSSVVVTDVDEETQAWKVLSNYIHSQHS
ncbi:unnamed protein product [Blepharisma stoltei]|uniref:40S ribosomal protein S12 n=1 Tax=Blepharisma stoltei TaxID=1481888 RepID=A0AAU9INA7_9CILI|nr:unnamed protein product [Blepharisma stoltei]|mmetsp:Transcript_7221/g.7076  ORF Transcript_7221/g.7076 Transcript_7221/m.7076 type:complete len:140 (+) Transcript_7221:29-448(+)|eukprot:CAMPEP_0202940608 /NCGR_PEP_ID=MMETSP1395-20130829/740_1 /ASSEMBLY_ACC=CAM_ASM_000871 /TAXON_ID=5961 /ORGANISM="Blepharisma japonicum, Strain Stock R1072" /LENGTH=139 /DNA_ID=CAMNT_0049635187 /DNA_START=45 /DNA_END=464 /DNA_ORIENTATION=-